MTTINTKGADSVVIMTSAEYNHLISELGIYMRKNTELNQEVCDLQARLCNWEGEQE